MQCLYHTLKDQNKSKFLATFRSLKSFLQFHILLLYSFSLWFQAYTRVMSSQFIWQNTYIIVYLGRSYYVSSHHTIWEDAIRKISHVTTITCTGNIIQVKLYLTIMLLYIISTDYYIVGKFGKFGESSAIRQTKTIQFNSYH